MKQLSDVNYAIQQTSGAKQFVVHVDKLKPVNVKVNQVCCCAIDYKMLECPESDHQGTSARAMQRHALGVHQMEWRGPGVPLSAISPRRLPEARERLRRLRLNSSQRRKERGPSATRPPAGVALLVSPVPGPARVNRLLATSGESVNQGFRPAGGESPPGSSGSCSSLELPKLSDGCLRDWDIDPEPWTTPPPTAEMGDRSGAVPWVHCLPIYVSTGVGDGEAGVADAGTDPDDTTRLGHPAGVDPGGLAQYISLWTTVPVAVLARQVISGPVDPEDQRAIYYAAQVAAATEHLLCANIAVGIDGALRNECLPGAEW